MQAAPNKTLFGFTFSSQTPFGYPEAVVTPDSYPEAVLTSHGYPEAVLTPHGHPEAIHALTDSLNCSVMTPWFHAEPLLYWRKGYLHMSHKKKLQGKTVGQLQHYVASRKQNKESQHHVFPQFQRKTWKLF